jgi:hypothetical protein
MGWRGSTFPPANAELPRRIMPRTGAAHITGLISPAHSGVRPAMINGWRSRGRQVALHSVDPAGLGDVGEADSEMDEIEKQIAELMAKKVYPTH